MKKATIEQIKRYSKENNVSIPVAKFHLSIRYIDGFSNEDKKILKFLLNKIGVYFIFDKNKKLIYIGRSKDLGSRILDSCLERNGDGFQYIETSLADSYILESYLIATIDGLKNTVGTATDETLFSLPSIYKDKIKQIKNKGYII